MAAMSESAQQTSARACHQDPEAFYDFMCASYVVSIGVG